MGRIRDLTYRKQFQDTFAEMYKELSVEADEWRKANGKQVSASEKNALLTKPITFVITENCNLRCTYCYECNKNYLAIMSKETAQKAVDMILDNEKMNGYIDFHETPAVSLEFIGGEPLIDVELMDYIVDYFRYRAFELNHPWHKNYMINVTSNGILYENEKVQKFIEKNKDRLSFTITIDGNKELHDACRIFPDGKGSFDIVYNAIKKAQKQIGLKETKVTFAPENINHISTAIPFLFNIGLTDINANCVYEDVWKPEHAPIFYKELIKLADWMIDNKIYQDGFCSIFDHTIGHPMEETENTNWCGGNGQMLAIGTDGRLFPCIRFMRYSLSNNSLPEFEIGNINVGIDSLEENKYLQCLNCITRRSQSTDECFNCPVASGCSWCTAYNYDKFSDPNKRATFICMMHKARVLANDYFWNKIYEIENDDRRFELNLKEEDIKFIKGENV